MMLALLGLAWAETCDPAAAVVDVRAGDREAYLCVIRDEQGRDVLVKGLDDGGEHPERLTRGLALWMLWHSDRPMDAALLARLSPADRRLLADGIKARRGRATPVPEHLAVFEQFSWYAPDPHYTDRRLRPIDRENLALIDEANAPTPPPEAPPEAPPGASSADTPNLCGCAVGGPAVGWAALLALVALTRRR